MPFDNFTRNHFFGIDISIRVIFHEYLPWIKRILNNMANKSYLNLKSRQYFFQISWKQIVIIPHYMVKSGSDDFGKCVFSKKLTSHWPEFQHEESHFHLQRFSFSFVHLLFIFWAVHVYHGLSSSFIFSWIHLIASWSYVSDENGSNDSRGQVPCDILKIKQWFLSARNK